jgi:phosphoribosylglycinamide formyltransferase-1
VNTTRLRTAVLISGTGSNLATLIRAVVEQRLDIDICQVVSNRADAGGLQHAHSANIPVSVLPVAAAGGRSQQEQQVGDCLEQCGAELIILAGYMLILGAGLVNRFRGRMINLHPSLLPLYPGLNTYQRVLRSGDSEHGASIHFVTPELDGGPVISQVRVPVLPGDTPGELAARLGPNEHRLVLATVELFARRRVKMRSGRVYLDDDPLDMPLLLNEDNAFDVSK